MGKLRPFYTVTGQIPAGQTSLSLAINHNGYEQVWVVEQIGVSYDNVADAPAATIYVDGQLYSGPAQFIPQGNSLGQSFGGQPYLYVEADDDVEIQIQNGSAGSNVVIQVQYRIISYTDNELTGRM